MSLEHSLDDKNKVKNTAPPQQDAAEKAQDPLTRSDIQGNLNPATVSRMQQTMGNQAVQRVLAQRSGGEGAFELDEDTTGAINNSRGGGQVLDPDMAERAGDTLGADMNNVRVHTDSNAVQLSEQVNARAFTVGSDIFFNQGEYSPGSQSGQELLAHELTHVAQQGGSSASAGNLTVNDPNDHYEKEADSVAQDIVNRKPQDTVQRQEEEEAQTKRVQRDEMPQEDELQLKPLQRQDIPEDEEVLQGKRLQRQEREDEDEDTMQLKRKPGAGVQRHAGHAADEGHEG